MDKWEQVLAPLRENPIHAGDYQAVRGQVQEMERRFRGLEETYGKVYTQILQLEKKLDQASLEGM